MKKIGDFIFRPYRPALKSFPHPVLHVWTTDQNKESEREKYVYFIGVITVAAIRQINP